MTEKEMLYEKIYEMLRNFRFNPALKGFNFLADAIYLIYTDKNDNYMDKFDKCLYPKIAENRNSTGKNVARGIRHLITTGEANDLFRRDPDFKFEKNGIPTSKPMITVFVEKFKKELAKMEKANNMLPEYNTPDDDAILRAFNVAPLVRVDMNGKVCPPWSAMVKDRYSDTVLRYAKPSDITTQLWTTDKTSLVPSEIEATNLKFLGNVITYHNIQTPDSNAFSATIAGVLKQIPDKVAGTSVTAFELFDPNLGSNQIVYIPESNSYMRATNVRLYGHLENLDKPSEVYGKDVIYKGHNINPKNASKYIQLNRDRAK